MAETKPFDLVAIAFGSIAGVASIVVELNRKGFLSPTEAEEMLRRAIGMLPTQVQGDVKTAYQELLPSLKI